MAIRFRCSGCDSVLKVGDELAQKKGKCPKCGTIITIPAESEVIGTSNPAAPPTQPAQAHPAQPRAAKPAQPPVSHAVAVKTRPPNGASETQHALGPVRRMCKPCYVISVAISQSLPWLGLFLLILGNIMGRKGESVQMVGGVLILLYFPAGLYMLFVAIQFYHKSWQAIQAAPARTTPTMAVLLLLVPCFNFYWVFQVHLGWAQDYNKLVTSRNLDAPLMSEGLALAVPILILGTAFILLPAPAMVVVQAIFWAQVCDRVNALAAVAAPTEE